MWLNSVRQEKLSLNTTVKPKMIRIKLLYIILGIYHAL